jgi:DNA polymerase-3 subunit alpha
MDGFPGTRAQLFAVIEDCMETGLRAQKDLASGQTGLFGALLEESSAASHERKLPNLPDWQPMEKLRGEKEMLGFYITGHPLDNYRDKVSEVATHTTDTLGSIDKATEVTVCGLLTGIQKRRNKEGKQWAVMQLEDWAGAVELLCFASKFELLGGVLEEDLAVKVVGRAMPEEDGTVKISAQEIVALDKLRLNFPSIISIRVKLNQNGNGKAEELQKLFERKPGATEVRFRLEKSRDFTVLMDVTAKVRPDKEFQSEVARICGPEAYEVLAS